MSKKSKNKGERTVALEENTTKEVEEIPVDADPDEAIAGDGDEGEALDEVGGVDMAVTGTVETPEAPVVEPVVSQVTTMTEAAYSEDEFTLIGMIDEFKKIMVDSNGFMKDETHLIKLIRLVEFVAKKDSGKLFDMVFNRLFLASENIVISDRVIFQKIETLNLPNMDKAKIMYSTMTAMKQYLDRPKRSGFPIDIKHVAGIFGGNSFGTFIKKTLGL